MKDRAKQVQRFADALRKAPGLAGTVHAKGKDSLVAYAEAWRDGKIEVATLREAIEPQIKWSIMALSGAREAALAALGESERA